MPSAAVTQGTGATTSASHPYCIFIDGLDVARVPGTPGTVMGVDIDTVEINERLGEPSRFSCVVDDPLKTFVPRYNADVYVVDHRGMRYKSGAYRTDDLFGGFLVSASKEPDGLGYRWTLDCISLEVLLDQRVWSSGVYPASTDVWSSGLTDTLHGLAEAVLTMDHRVTLRYADWEMQPGTAPDGGAASLLHGTAGSSLVIPLGFLKSAVAFTGKTVRQVLMDINAVSDQPTDVALLADGEDILDVDQRGRIRYYPQWGVLPYEDIKQGTPANSGIYAGRPAPYDIEVQKDTSNLINAVYVRGIDGASSGWVEDAASIATYGRREAFLESADVVSSTSRDQTGRTYLLGHTVNERIQFSLAGTHDSLIGIPTVFTNEPGVGWHPRAVAYLWSADGYWTDGALALCYEVTKRFSGGGQWMQLDLSFQGASNKAASALSVQRADLSLQTQSATRLRGALDEVAVRSKTGAPTDADFDVPRDGYIVVDTTNGFWYTRIGGNWIVTGRSTAAGISTVAMAAGAPTSWSVTYGTLVGAAFGSMVIAQSTVPGSVLLEASADPADPTATGATFWAYRTNAVNTTFSWMVYAR